MPPKSFHPRANVYLPVLRPFPVRSFSFYSAQRCPRDTRSMSSTRKSSLAKITCRTHSASWTDVHDNSCFNYIVLINMPSGTTFPAVAAATILCDPLLYRILLQTHFNISIKEYSHLHVLDHHQLDYGSTCSLEMHDGSHDGCLLDTLYNGQGIYYKYTWSSIRCFTFISRDRRRRDTSNGCALSMCVCQHRQLCGFNSVDDASLITGKDDSLTCHLGQGLLERLDGRDLTLVVVYNTVAKSTHGTRLKPTHTYTSFS